MVDNITTLTLPRLPHAHLSSQQMGKPHALQGPSQPICKYIQLVWQTYIQHTAVPLSRGPLAVPAALAKLHCQQRAAVKASLNLAGAWVMLHHRCGGCLVRQHHPCRQHKSTAAVTAAGVNMITRLEAASSALHMCARQKGQHSTWLDDCAPELPRAP